MFYVFFFVGSPLLMLGGILDRPWPGGSEFLSLFRPSPVNGFQYGFFSLSCESPFDRLDVGKRVLLLLWCGFLR